MGILIYSLMYLVLVHRHIYVLIKLIILTFRNFKLINYRDIDMGQHHCINISRGHAAYASTSHINNSKGGGTKSINSKQGSVWDAHCPATVIPPSSHSNDGAGGHDNKNKVACGMHSASHWWLDSYMPSSSTPSTLFAPCLLLIHYSWLTAPVTGTHIPQ